MAVTLIKKDKGVIAAAAKTDLEIKVDRLIELKMQIDEVKSATTEYEKLRKELSGLADTVGAANEQVVFSGDTGDAVFSPKSFERGITDMAKVFEFLGKDTFLKIAKVTMTDIDKYLGEAEKETVVAQTLTGSRKISVVAKAKEVTQQA